MLSFLYGFIGGKASYETARSCCCNCELTKQSKRVPGICFVLPNNSFFSLSYVQLQSSSYKVLRWALFYQTESEILAGLGQLSSLKLVNINIVWFIQSYEIKSPPWTILWFRILGIFPVEYIKRLCVFMFQTWDNNQLLRKVLWNSAELTIVSSLKHKNTQPRYIFNKVRVLHLDRLKEGTWLHSFDNIKPHHQNF